MPRPRHCLAMLAALAVLGTAAACGDVAEPGSAGTEGRSAPSPTASLADAEESSPSASSPSASPSSAGGSAQDESTASLEASPTPESSHTGIPADFPLDAGMESDGGDFQRYEPSPDHDGLGSVAVCGGPVWPSADVRVVDSRALAVSGPEYADNRYLFLFADADGALTALGPVRNAVRGCRSFDNQVWTPIRRDTGYDTVTVGLSYTEGLGSSVFQWTRVGRAVLLMHTYGEGSVESLPAQADAVTQDVLAIVPAMCAFTEAGCGGPEPASSIPDDYPLATGWPEPDGVESKVSGPDREGEAFRFTGGCGPDAADPAHVDRMWAGFSGPEDYRGRQLTTYASELEAEGAVEALVAVFESCPRGKKRRDGHRSENEVRRVDVGEESWAILQRDTFDGGETPFGRTTVVVREGAAVLVLDWGGHSGYPQGDGRAKIDQLVEEAADPIAQLCTFAEAGCS